MSMYSNDPDIALKEMVAYLMQKVWYARGLRELAKEQGLRAWRGETVTSNMGPAGVPGNCIGTTGHTGVAGPPGRLLNDGEDEEGISKTAEISFPHGELLTLQLCDEWIASTLRKLPRGALAKLYRILHDGEGLSLSSASVEESRWKDSFRT